LIFVARLAQYRRILDSHKNEWCIVFKRLSVSVLVLSLASSASAWAAKTACFTPDEAKAAQLRVLQQEFNVAALNCQTVDPNDPKFSDRYNAFVGKFGDRLQENATALHRHFSRAGGNFDLWMTRVANDAGQRVFADANFCQQAWENLDKALAVEPKDIETFASTAGTPSAQVQTCAETKAKPAAKKPAKTASKD
jgi:hypothetical protein